MESWDGRTSFNTKVEAFEALGLNQGDALKLAELNWRELSIEVRGALNEVAGDEKEEKRDDIQDAFNNEGDGVGSQPDTQIEELDDIHKEKGAVAMMAFGDGILNPSNDMPEYSFGFRGTFLRLSIAYLV